jgi:hypothetical protein
MDEHQAKTEANHEELMAIMKASGKRMEALVEVSLEGTRACRDVTEASLEKTEARMDTGQETMETEIKICLKEVKATDLEANSEETEAVAVHQEVLKEYSEKTCSTLRDLGSNPGHYCGKPAINSLLWLDL